MGRVYNALVRAERWKHTDRPIGRPDRNDAATGRRGDAATIFSVDVSSAAAPSFVFEDNFALTEEPTTLECAEPSVVAESAELTLAAGTSAQAARRVTPLARRQVSGSLAPSSSPKFEEPSTVSNIRDLGTNPHVAVLSGEDRLAVERYHTLAVKLLNLAHRRKLKTLMVTSAEAGEGKTTVAIGAAWSIAKHSEGRVLLIDANPTSSSAGRMLGIEGKRGWLNLVDGSCELKDALIRLEPNGLYLLTPGSPMAPQSTGAVISRWEDLIADLAARFDLVVVDSSSILESAEAQRLATVLDGVIIVARASHTHHSKVTAARKLVPKERRLGVVLNESEIDTRIAQRGSKGTSWVRRFFGSTR